jgi:hypothetical protein
MSSLRVRLRFRAKKALIVNCQIGLIGQHVASLASACGRENVRYKILPETESDVRCRRQLRSPSATQVQAWKEQLVVSASKASHAFGEHGLLGKLAQKSAQAARQPEHARKPLRGEGTETHAKGTQKKLCLATNKRVNKQKNALTVR